MNQNEFPYPLFTETGKTICQLCGKEVSFLSPQHLKKEHQLTTTEYKEKFPGAPFTSKATKLRMSESLTKKPIEDPPVNNNVINEDEYDKLMKEAKTEKDDSIVMKNYDIPVEVQENTNISLSFQSIDIPQEEEISPPNKVLGNKYKFYNELKKILPDLKMNYFIEKKSLDGMMMYSYITDFADPEKKVVIDFPHTFWHNRDTRIDNSKNKKLENDKWKVVTIGKNDNAIEKVKKYLE